jgi:glycosyltransferase involved in cell wall biosynthesis
VDIARRWLEEFAPDFVSLQFVCYGFHPRGFVGRVAPHLRAILHGWPLHVFMHELWLGEQCRAPWKERLLGWVQRRGALSLLGALDVRSTHTSNPAYVEVLHRRGLPARLLPLFGALPLPSREPALPGGRFVFAFFGTLHPVWPPEPLLGALRTLGRPVTLAHVGHIGSGAALWERLEREYRDAFTFTRLDEMPPQQIADFFATAHFGIATTPWELIGKSGTTAAMLDAGLPVIVNRDDVHYPGMLEIPADPLLLRMQPDLPARLVETQRRAPKLHVAETAARFLTDWESVVKR